MMLHDKHIGIIKSKQLARRYFFWPGLNKEIEDYASKCLTCKEINADRQKKAYQPWPKAQSPFERIYLDFFTTKEKHFYYS